MNPNRTTSAGKWSVALAIFPISIAACLLLFVMVPVWTGHVHGEGGLGVMLAIGQILYYGSHMLAATSLLGTALAIFTVCKTKWQRGIVGFLLNMSVLFLVGSFLFVTYHRRDIDPDRLPIAAYQGDYKTVEKLLAKGFDINQKCGDNTALSHESQRGDQKLVELLLSHSADVNIGNPLDKAVRWGKCDPKVIKTLLEHGANPNCLHGAVSRQKEIVQLLLDYKADVNQKDNNGRTPLHFAVISGREDNIKLLISNSADVNARNNNGETPLHTLVQMYPQIEWPEGYRERVIKILLDAGADIEAKTKKGQTPLCVAAEAAKSNDAVRTLSELDADLANVKDLHLRFTALPVSIDKSNVKAWVQANAADINAKNTRGESLLHAAVKGSNQNLVEVLLEMGAAINVQDNTGDTPLHWAVKYPNLNIIQILLGNKADTDIQNKKGQTPLCILAKPRTIADEKLPYQSQIKACGLLLTNGAKIDIKDNNGKTPLDSQQRWLPRTQDGLQYQKEMIQLMQKYKGK